MKASLFALLFCVALTVSANAGVIGGKRLFRFQTKADFSRFDLTGACWGADGINYEPPGLDCEGEDFTVGMIQSPEIATGLPCDQIVVSWNSITPPGSYLTVYIQARCGGTWSRRFTVGIWNRDNRPVERMSVNGQTDDLAEMDCDILRLKKPADAFRVSAKLSSLDGKTYPTLRMLTVQALNSHDIEVKMRPRKSVWGKDLAVPERSQLTVPEGNRFCSATSTAMVLDYWSQKLNRPELSVPLQEAVDRIYDKEFGGTGNWPFNCAFAAEFGGLKCYVTRFADLAMLEEWIAKDVPVIVSMDYNILMHREAQGKMGHLMVFRGFTDAGDCIINDPYTNLDRGERVRKVFIRGDFAESWLSNKAAMGTVYLIYPDGWKIPANGYLEW